MENREPWTRPDDIPWMWHSQSSSCWGSEKCVVVTNVLWHLKKYKLFSNVHSNILTLNPFFATQLFCACCGAVLLKLGLTKLPRTVHTYKGDKVISPVNLM